MKKVHGYGINDIGCVDNNSKRLKSYISWKGMLERVYSEKYHKNQPTYIGCSVCKEWLTFSNYKKWHDINYVEGYQLDKDILVLGNKEYSSETCRFVPQYINKLLTDRRNDRGGYVIGVSKNTLYPHKSPKEFVARCCTFDIVTKKSNKSRHLGLFYTELEAHLVYKQVKENNVKVIAQYYYEQGLIDYDIYQALINWQVK